MIQKSMSATVTIAAAIMLSSIGAIRAQEPQAAPRTPMSPGSATYGMAPTDRDRAIWGFSHGLSVPMAPAMANHVQSLDLLPSDTQAISTLAEGKADVVISSRADAELVVQLFRPDQNQWQEYRVAPLANTPISCSQCGGKLKFSFNDGTQQSDIDIQTPAVLRIFRDPAGTRWQWDAFRLEAAAKSE